MTRITLSAVALLTFASAAEAQPKVLPPEEYSHYAGLVVTTRARDQEHVRELCPGMTFNLGVALGCSFRYPNGCLIVLAPDDVIRAAGWEPDIVRRHELGHCAGWPMDHRGAR